MKDKFKQELYSIYSTKQPSPQKERKIYLDMAKGFAIILVVLGHNPTVGSTPNTWLSTFHMPIFFIVSGFLLQQTTKYLSSIHTFFRKRVKGILVPYLYFSLGSIPFLLFKFFQGDFGLDVIGNFLLTTVTLQGFSVLWFLPVLFFAELLVILFLKLWKKVCRENPYSSVCLCIFTTLAALLSYYCYQLVITANFPALLTGEIRLLVKAVIGSAFISYGYLVSQIISRIEKYECSSNKRTLLRLTDFLIGIILSSINVIIIPYIKLTDLNNLNIGFLPQYLFLGITGSFGLIFLCRSLPNIPLLSYYGQNSLIIMCTHLNFYVLYLAIEIEELIALYITGYPSTLHCLVSMLLVMILEIPAIIFIKIFFPFALGKPLQRNHKI